MTLFADTGIPMLAVVWPIAWLAFFPVVIIESSIALKGLGLGFRRAFVVTAAANAVSTLVGIPITWFILVVVSIVTGGGVYRDLSIPTQALLAVSQDAPWLVPYEHELGWMIPVAAIFLCIPFYFASVWIEYLVVRRMVPNSAAQVRRFCWRANLWSYMAIIIFYAVCLVTSV